MGRLSISDYEWRFTRPERLFAMNRVTFPIPLMDMPWRSSFFTLVPKNHLPELSWRQLARDLTRGLSSPLMPFSSPCSSVSRAQFPISRRSLKQLDAHGHDMICNRDGAMSRSCRFWEQFAINNFLLRLFGRYYRQMWMAHKETESH